MLRSFRRRGLGFFIRAGVAASALSLLVSPLGIAQDNRSKPATRTAATRPLNPRDAELARLRADVIDKLKESRARAEKLLALHEEERSEEHTSKPQQRFG